jgi:prefoldin subunit 5
MAQQIKKKFIGSDQIDGSKIKLLEGQSIRGTNSLGQEVDLVKIGSGDKVQVLGQEVALKSALEQESSDRQSADASTLASAQSYADQKVAALVNSAPEVLDTLKELSDALGGDANFAATVAGQIGAVDDRVDQEILDRQNADAAEVLARDAAISVAVMAEQQAREAFDALLQSSLEEEIEDRQGVDEELSQRIDSTATSLMGTIGAVNDRAIAAEQELQTSIAAEQSRASQAEQDLDSRLDILEPKVSSLESEMDSVEQSVLAEQSARISADAALQAQIDALDTGFVTESELDSAVASLESQIDDLDGYTQEIRSDLDDLDGYAQELRSDLDQEISDRQAADSLLSSSVSELGSELDQEKLDRAAADLILSSSISSLQTQVAADIQQAVSAEASLRQSGDSSLQSQIDVEKGRVDAILSASGADSDSFAEIVSLINSIDTQNDQAFAGYVTSNNAAVSALQSGLSQEVLDRQAADALKENLSNKSTDSALGDSDALYPTQKAVKDHVIASQSVMSRKLLTGEGIDTLIPADISVETADRHYSGGAVHALNPGYICYFTDTSFIFVDARNPFAVNIYKTLTFSTAANNFPQAITAIGNYLLVAMSNGRVYTIDWSDLQNPSIFGFKTIGSGQHYDMCTDGSNTLFLGNTTNNCVYAVDITDRTNPTLINSVALGGFGTGVAFNAGYLYVTNYSNKLHTLQKNVTTNLWEQVAVLNTITNPNRCRIVENSRGEKLLFAMRYNGVDAVFYSLSSPAAPVEAKRLVMASAMQIYAVPFSHENMVHVGLTNGTVGGISIVDIADPKIAGAYTPVNSDGSKKFSEMRVIIKTSTKSPYFKDKALLLASGIRVGGSSAQKTTAPVQLPVINHDSVELLARPTVASVNGSIASEAQARLDADNALDSRLDVLEGRGFSRGVVTVSSELSFIDLDKQYSILLSVAVGRLMVHEGEDFTVSVVAGKTRLTWIGSLVSPSGEEAIEAGDKVFFSGAF